MVAAHRAENVDTGRRLDLLGERDDRTRQLRHEAGNPPALTTAIVDDGDPIDIDIVDRRHDLVDELREHVEHEDALAVITSSLVLLRETLEHLDLRLAVLDDLRRLRLSGELLGFKVGLGGRDDIGLEAATLQLDALLLELLLGGGTRNVAGDGRLLLLGLGNRFELRSADAELVLLLDDVLVGLHRGDLGSLAGGRLGRLGLSHPFGFGHTGLLDDLGRESTADRVEVLVVVGDVLDLHHVKLETQRLDVVVGFVDQLMRELQPVLVDLFRRQRGEYTAQVGFERLLGDLADLLGGTVEEAFGGVLEQTLGARHLDVGDALHIERDRALRVGVGDRDLERDRVEIHPGDLLQNRDSKRAAALENAIADRSAIRQGARSTGDHGDLIGGTDHDQRTDNHDHEQDREHGDDRQGECSSHQGSLFPGCLRPDRRLMPGEPGR